MAEKLSREVNIENVGPIRRLRIPLPESGVVVLRGRNGVGKSHALAAVDSLVSGRGRPVCRDGEKRGVVEGFGARLTVARSVRRTNEAEVLTLEGRFDISRLVEPGLKDEEAADRVRVKALLQLAGVVGGPQIFSEVVPEGFALDDERWREERDPVVLAGAIRRGLQEDARRWEGEAERRGARAASLEEEAAGVAEGALSLEGAGRELEAALLAQRELEVRAQEAMRRYRQGEEAKRQLEQFGEDVAGEEELERLREQKRGAEERVLELRRELERAEGEAERLRGDLRRLEGLRSRVASLQEAVAASSGVELVTDEERELAAERVEAARRAQEEALQAEEARKRLGRAEGLRAEAEEYRRRAEEYREASWATDEVLTGLVGRVTGKLRVEGGRLKAESGERGWVPVGELSPGERWRLALEVALEHVGRGGLVTVPQEAWDGLDPRNRAEVARLAKEVGVVVLAAEAGGSEEIEVSEEA